MKKLLSLCLALLLLGSVAMPAFAYDPILVAKPNAAFTLPKAGDPVDYKSLPVDDPDAYGADIISVYYKNSDGGYTDAYQSDPYLSGVTYFVRIKFYAKDGYLFDSDKTEFCINGNPADRRVADTKFEVVFVPEEKESLNFFQRIVAFFSDLFTEIRIFFENLFLKA